MGCDRLSYRSAGLPHRAWRHSCARTGCAFRHITPACAWSAAATAPPARLIAPPTACPKPCAVVQGGATRADSVAQSAWPRRRASLLPSTTPPAPLSAESVITAALTAAAETGAAAPAVPVKDTVKIADPSGRVLDTPDRATLYAVQDAAVLPPRTLHPGACRRHGEKARLVTEIVACLSWPVLPV